MSWNKLVSHQQDLLQQSIRIADLLSAEPGRVANNTIEFDGLLLDYSKHLATEDTWSILQNLAEEANLKEAIDALFAGDAVNNTENRPALHCALREQELHRLPREVADALSKMEKLCSAIHNGDWTGFSGEAITDVVNIGIGGSHLGPAMAETALKGSSSATNINCHFVSNVDPSHLHSTVTKLSPANTLFIIASKSFKTLETRQNATAARQWFINGGGQDQDIAKHFVAISTNHAAAEAFGIPEDNVFPMWDWVGGRYSLWSAIGLPLALAIGFDNFKEFLRGGNAMDKHFATAPIRQNMPIVMALLAVWYSHAWKASNHAVIPYNQSLNLFPEFLQQLCMESLGKSVDKQGQPVTLDTGEIVWGSAGTNGQHSYFQLLHQGTRLTPVDFIAIANKANANESSQANDQQIDLLANCLGQSKALMEGLSIESLAGENTSLADNTPLAPHRAVAGNKPSSTLLLHSLTPYSLGQLVALYEHKVYAQSVLWNINAFDQWGVELGKQLSTSMKNAFSDSDGNAQLDSSSQMLIKKIKLWQAS